jgi:hypothetical protein
MGIRTVGESTAVRIKTITGLRYLVLLQQINIINIQNPTEVNLYPSRLNIIIFLFRVFHSL